MHNYVKDKTGNKILITITSDGIKFETVDPESRPTSVTLNSSELMQFRELIIDAIRFAKIIESSKK